MNRPLLSPSYSVIWCGALGSSNNMLEDQTSSAMHLHLMAAFRKATKSLTRWIECDTGTPLRTVWEMTQNTFPKKRCHKWHISQKMFQNTHMFQNSPKHCNIPKRSHTEHSWCTEFANTVIKDSFHTQRIEFDWYLAEGGVSQHKGHNGN